MARQGTVDRPLLRAGDAPAPNGTCNVATPREAGESAHLARMPGGPVRLIGRLRARLTQHAGGRWCRLGLHADAHGRGAMRD